MINKLMYYIFKCGYHSEKFRIFKHLICDFYDNYNVAYTFTSFGITKCRIYDFPKRVVIIIHSLSPGIIIGKRGQCIDLLKEYMQKRYSKPVEIKLEETNPFK